MNRYNGLKHQVLALFASTQGEWLEPNEAAERLDFFPARSAWTYFKRLWSFGLLERRSSGRGTLEYGISELGRAASMVTFTGKLTGAFAPVEPSKGTNFSGKWPTGFDRGQRGRIVLLVTFAGALYTP